MTAPTHMAQYAPEVLQKMLDLVRCIEGKQHVRKGANQLTVLNRPIL